MRARKISWWPFLVAACVFVAVSVQAAPKKQKQVEVTYYYLPG